MKDAAPSRHDAAPFPRHVPSAPPLSTRTVLAIIGMRSNACREVVAEALEATAGVEDVDVNLHRSRAVVVHRRSCLSSGLVGAVVGAGYDAAILVVGGVSRHHDPARSGAGREANA